MSMIRREILPRPCIVSSKLLFQTRPRWYLWSSPVWTYSMPFSQRDLFLPLESSFSSEVGRILPPSSSLARSLAYLHDTMTKEPTTAVQPMEVEKVENAPENASKEENVADGGVVPAPSEPEAAGEEEENKQAEVVPKRMVAPSKVVLKLDNGTLAKFACETRTVELLSPDAAFKAGALTEADLLRLQSYLCAVHAKLPSEGPLKSVSLMSSKRSYDTVLDVGPGGAAVAKKAKSLLAMAGQTGGGSTLLFVVAALAG